MLSYTKLAKANLDGAPWYVEAQKQLETVAKLENWELSQLVGILAVTSPRVSVRRNIRITLQYLGRGEFLPNVMRSVRKSVETLEATGKILGKKTSAFYAALLGDVNAVVLDIHMANLFRVAPSVFSTKQRERYVRTVNRVADRIGLEPRDTQACLWYAQKRSVGEQPIGFPIVEEYKNWLLHNREFNGGTIENYLDSRVAMPLFDKLPF